MKKIALNPNVFQRDYLCLKSRKISIESTDLGFQKLISGASTWVVESNGLVFWQGDSIICKLSPVIFGLKMLQNWSIQSY